jgi:hypothetical protein
MASTATSMFTPRTHHPKRSGAPSGSELARAQLVDPVDAPVRYGQQMMLLEQSRSVVDVEEPHAKAPIRHGPDVVDLGVDEFDRFEGSH